MPMSDPGRPSRYHHGNLKKTIVQTAIQLIEERGEASFTIRELAKSVGVSHAAAYRHFRSKRQLSAQIAEEGFHGLQAEFDEILRKNEKRSRRARIRGLGNAYVQYALRHPGHFRAMFHIELQARGDFPSLKEAGTRAFDSLLNLSGRNCETRAGQPARARASDGRLGGGSWDVPPFARWTDRFHRS